MKPISNFWASLEAFLFLSWLSLHTCFKWCLLSLFYEDELLLFLYLSLSLSFFNLSPDLVGRYGCHPICDHFYGLNLVFGQVPWVLTSFSLVTASRWIVFRPIMFRALPLVFALLSFFNFLFNVNNCIEVKVKLNFFLIRLVRNWWFWEMLREVLLVLFDNLFLSNWK